MVNQCNLYIPYSLQTSATSIPGMEGRDFGLKYKSHRGFEERIISFFNHLNLVKKSSSQPFSYIPSL